MAKSPSRAPYRGLRGGTFASVGSGLAELVGLDVALSFTHLFVPLSFARRYYRSCVLSVASATRLRKNSNKICFFARLFVSLQPNSNSIVMTTIELRSSILADLDEMSVEMLQNVSHYVKRLRRHARPVKQTVTDEAIPDVVLSLLGAGDPIADEDLNAREAYNQYLEEKYK